MKYHQSTGAIEENIIRVIEPFLTAGNYELVNVVYLTENKEKIIRLFVDKAEGITLGDCAHISHEVGDLIDVYVENIGHYRLEVSSPGPNRPLKTKKDFYRFAGRTVKIEIYEPIEGQKKFKGILETVNDDSVHINVAGNTVKLLDSQISKAALSSD